MALKPSILANSYVKFVRTNPTLWGSLVNKDPDTLYFIVNNGSEDGSLYLGSTLIASGINEKTPVEDLKNVIITGEVSADQVLVSDGYGSWKNRNIYDFMPVTMKGASEAEDGAGGLVPAPATGEQNLFLQGDGTWANPTAAMETTVGNLAESLEAVQAQLTTVIGSDLNKTMRAVATEVTNSAISTLVNDAPEAFNTLKEIADWITGDHEGSVDAADLITDVANLKTIVSDETVGLVSRVGVLETSVGDLNTAVNTLAETVGGATYGLVKKVNDNATNIASNASAIIELGERLMWRELVEEVEN